MAEKRREPRRRALKGARIVFHDRGATIDCTVRNISDGGALLEVESQIGVPDRFDLVFVCDDSRRSCRVTRRAGNTVSVAFQ